MKAVTATAAVLGLLLVLGGEATDAGPPASAPAAPAKTLAAPAPAVSPQALTGVVQRYCQVCHNDQLLTGNLSLQGFDVAAAGRDRATAEKAEKMIVKLRAAM